MRATRSEPDTPCVGVAKCSAGNREGRDAGPRLVAYEGLSVPERRAARPEAIRTRLADATVDEAAACRRGLVLYHHN
mgnify:CR=1 FL=1